MTEDQLHKAAHRMREQGGSFAAHIADAYFVADRSNTKLLLGAFGPLFERYAPAQTCPHCARDLEGEQELATGLCTSEDCPRHD